MGIRLHEHNQAAYSAAVSMLEKTGKAAIIHPTGTGKSFIGFYLCQQFPDKTVCWLSPSDYIFKTQLENLRAETEGYAPENIRFYTYAKLMMMPEAEIAQIRPDYIILDEFHRCGAEQWGKGVRTLLAVYPDAKLLGLSATNIRYLDNQRDMADELFDGNIASRMTLSEAIVQGVLTPPVYVTALYSCRKELEKYQRRAEKARTRAVRDAAETYLEALRRNLEKAEGLDEIFARHMTDRHGKYIVFCAGAEHMREMIEKAGEHFGKIDGTPHIYSAYSSDPATSRAFAAFKEDASDHLKLLYCIDMLNEGIHVEGISGVILFRPTVSPTVYKQQIGRAMRAGNKGGAVILDIVDNVSSLYSIGALQEEIDETVQFYQYRGEEKYIVNDSFRVIDEMRECRELFEELENTLGASWDCMYSAARKYYEANGNLLPKSGYVTEEGYHLGRWVAFQRGSYARGELSPSRIARLEEIGMSWLTLHERFWEENYGLAEAYYREHGHLRVTEKQLPKLSYWLARQRSKYQQGQLGEEQFRRLDALGMVWEPEDVWAAKYEKARAFYEANGHLDIPVGYVTADGTRLGMWYRTVRRQYKAGMLPAERIRLLEEIGMQWQSVLTRKWMEYYGLAEAYYREHGDLNVNARYETENGVKLGVWISSQRSAYGKGTLSGEQIELLERIGMSWHRDVSRWEAGFGYAQAYFEKFGTLRVPKDYVTEDGFALGSWITTQRTRYRMGKLKSARVSRLESIGMVWDIAETFWQTGYEHARAYCREHGDLNVHGAYVCDDGFKLGSWIENQINRYKKGQLTAEQTEKLEKAGMVWQRQERQWHTNYEYARAYYEAYGNLDVPLNYVTEDGFALGEWLRAQRRQYQRGRLNADRRTMLERFDARFSAGPDVAV